MVCFTFYFIQLFFCLIKVVTFIFSLVRSSVFIDFVRSTTVRYCFHRCLSVHRGEGVPQGTYPLPPSQGTYSPPPGQVLTGGTPRYLPPSQSTYLPWPRYYPQPGPNGRGRDTPRYLPPPPLPRYLPPSPFPPPPPRDRTANGVLDTPQSVCLLRSHRRTFLFKFVSTVKHLVIFIFFHLHYMLFT